MDEDNKIECTVAFGKQKNKPQDYFETAIMKDGKPVSKIIGTYLGWIEIDGKRLFDYRSCDPF